MRKISCAFFAVMLSVVFIGGCDSQEAVGPAAGTPTNSGPPPGAADMLKGQMKNAKMKEKPAKGAEKEEKK